MFRKRGMRTHDMKRIIEGIFIQYNKVYKFLSGKGLFNVQRSAMIIYIACDSEYCY